MSAEPQTKKTRGVESTRTPVASPTAAGRARLQRSPVLIVFGLVILAAGGVFGWFMWATTSSASEVVAAKVAVERGQVITAADLTTVRVTLDPSLRTIRGSELKTLVGRRAASDVAAGTLISPNQVSDELVPPQGWFPAVIATAGGSGRLAGR